MPVRELTLPPGVPPNGICGTCRFFVDEPNELMAELAFMSSHGNGQKRGFKYGERVQTGRKMVVHTREGTKESFDIPDGAKVQTVVDEVGDIMRLLHDRAPQVKAWDWGLCELGVVGLTDRRAGLGPVPGPCEHWKEGTVLVNIRPFDWKAKMREILKAGGLAKIPDNAPCICEKGRVFGYTFANCCKPVQKHPQPPTETP